MSLKYLKNVTTLRFDPDRCAGCGMCVSVCPHQVFILQDRKARIRAVDRCMECGACARNCAFGAISVRAGVGCAAAILTGLVRRTEPQCGCRTETPSCCS